MPIVDTHAHIWSRTDTQHLPGLVVQPAVPVTVAALRAHMLSAGVDRAVLVQPIHPGDDHEAIREAVAAEPSTFAAVAAPSVDAGRISAFVAGDTAWLKGIRLRPRRPSERAAFHGEDVAPLFALADAAGKIVSVLGTTGDAPRILEWARRFPRVRIVIDHFLGMDPADPGSVAAVRGLATAPNVLCRLSGLHYLSGLPHPHADCQLAVRAVVDAFGSGRTIWGADFPHGLLYAPYAAGAELVERCLGPLAGPDMDRVMGANAAALYWSS